MSNGNYYDPGFNTLGANSNEPISDLTLSTMVVGNQEAMMCRLIMVLLFLYAYTNSYLMCTNDKLLCNQMCLTDKMVDNLMDSLANCRKKNRH